MLDIVGLAILSCMFTFWFEPIQGIKMRLLGWLPDWALLPFVCSKCFGLWIGLLYFQDPFKAALTSFLAYVIDYIIYRIDNGKDGTIDG